MKWIKSGIEIPSKSEVIGRCGGEEKNEWPRRTDKSPSKSEIIGRCGGGWKNPNDHANCFYYP